jgi:hypothetical protein
MTAGEIARHIVAEAVWAPSVHNTQPWRFMADGQQISLCADADRGLPVATESCSWAAMRCRSRSTASSVSCVRNASYWGSRIPSVIDIG